MEALKKSMDEFDITQPILVQKKTGLVIAGHGRLEAFKARGMKDIPVIYLDLSDAKAKAYALVDNQTTINYGWDEVLLELSLDDIATELPDLDMDLFGFGDIDGLPDNVNDPQKEWDGMPEFQMDDQQGRALIVHFRDEKDVQKFSKLLKQKITPQTKFVWYPEQFDKDHSTHVYVEGKK
jgi:hypothetical protein